MGDQLRCAAPRAVLRRLWAAASPAGHAGSDALRLLQQRQRLVVLFVHVVDQRVLAGQRSRRSGKTSCSSPS